MKRDIPSLIIQSSILLREYSLAVNLTGQAAHGCPSGLSEVTIKHDRGIYSRFPLLLAVSGVDHLFRLLPLLLSEIFLWPWHRREKARCVVDDERQVLWSIASKGTGSRIRCYPVRHPGQRFSSSVAEDNNTGLVAIFYNFNAS